MKDLLSAAIGGAGPSEARHAAALRLRCVLKPVGGDGARVMPPTYRGPDGGPVYAYEQRRIGERVVRCVLLDSIASQANRMEEALLERLRTADRTVPDVVVDQQEFGTYSALEFSHRVFDAWVEDAELDGKPFGKTDEYADLASVINRGVALPLVERFPVGLLLGCWASRRTNPQGSTRLARAITSEIIGVDAEPGVRPAGRIDLHHVSTGVKLVEADEDARFRLLRDDEDPKKLPLVGKKADGGRGDGRPSNLGYGNVTPSLSTREGREHPGGVTIDYALQQTVVSISAIRVTCARRIRQARDSERDLAARRLLTNLAIAMLEAHAEHGWDLRSGCHLVPVEEPTVELISRVGTVLDSRPLYGLQAWSDLAAEVNHARAVGIDWSIPPLALTASAEQLDLLRASHSLATAGDEPEATLA